MSILLLRVLLLWFSLLQTSEGQSNRNVTFMFVTSFGQFGPNTSGVVPAADIALEDINANPDILPGYNLVYDVVRDSQLSYASEVAPHSDRTAFPRFFQSRPPFEMITESVAIFSIMDHFRWRRIATLTQDEIQFTRAEVFYRHELELRNITVANHVFETLDNPVDDVSDLFFQKEDYRVIFLNCYPEPARKILCEAARLNLSYPRYTWITYDWYSDGWWEENVPCDSKMLIQFLNRVITIRRLPLRTQSNLTTDAGITPMEFESKYSSRAAGDGFRVIEAGFSVYDVLWVLAKGLNSTMAMVKSGNISHTGCRDVPGSLVNFEDFNHTNMRMGCLIRWNLENTKFLGVSGLIQYDVNRTLINKRVILRQYRINGNGSLNREPFAHLDRQDNYTFTFEPGFNDSTVFPDGVSLDGTILNITHTFETELVVVFDVLATLGIVFAIGCLIFNCGFRNRKIVKISSPSLNYFIILGALLMYTSIFFYLLPSLNTDIVLTGCILQTWLFTIGCSLSFGAVLAKMWRVYQIFNNPKPKKKVLKDWHLVATTMLVTGVATALLILEAAVPQLRGVVTQERDGEHSQTRTADLGIRQDFYVLVCYETASPNFFWRIFIFAYLAIIQLLGIVLSFQTRKVKHTGLRDSKFITIIIYISSIVIVVLALVTFSLRTKIHVGTGIFVTGYFILTTIMLALIFIPKMVLLYKDPHGKFITENTITRSVKQTGVKFPSQIPRSGNDGHTITQEANTDMNQNAQ